MNRVKLVSGGVDSFIMSQQFEGKNVYVDFGQNYTKEEQQSLKDLGVDFETIKVDSIFKETEIFINCRNLCLACLIAMTYNADEIYMAGLKDDNCVDKTEVEFDLMSRIISRYCNHPVKVISPYWNMTKGELVQSYPDKKRLLKTFSCYNPQNGKPCCDCPACLRRIIALETNFVDTGLELSDRVLKEYMSKIHTYDQDRISRFMFYLQKRKKIYAVDIDGVLCGENKEKLDLVDTDKLDGYVALYTSRLKCDRTDTEDWLQKNNIKYDMLFMNKLPYDLLLDDRCKKIGGIEKE